MRRRAIVLSISVALAFSVACGGKSATTNNATAVQSSPATLRITSSALPRGLQGTSYTATLSATGGTGALHWSVSAGSLPGLSIDPSTGVLSGTLNFGGDTGFTAQVTDSGTPQQTATKFLTL